MEAEIIKSKGTEIVRKVMINISGNRYILTESVDAKLCINKADGEDGAICVFPRVSNEIEII